MQPVAPAGTRAPAYRWYHRLWAVVFIIFCFEIGVFLLVFPWLKLWSVNYFSSLAPWWRPIWESPYFRGAISGVGLINICISFAEIFRLRRFARNEPPAE
jgi:hypothetical protein